MDSLIHHRFGVLHPDAYLTTQVHAQGHCPVHDYLHVNVPHPSNHVQVFGVDLGPQHRANVVDY